jgi:hypothetical protein
LAAEKQISKYFVPALPTTWPLTNRCGGVIIKSALEFAANCPSVGKMTPTREFSGGAHYPPIHAPQKSLHISRFGRIHGQTRRFAVAALLKRWVFATHSCRFILRGQIVSFSPLSLYRANERARRCDY